MHKYRRIDNRTYGLTMTEINRRIKYYSSKAFKAKQEKMKTLLVKGMYWDSARQHTNFIYAHGELEKMYGYDLVTVFAWGAFLDDVGDGIYNVKFICPDNTIVKAKAFVWTYGYIYDIPRKKGLVVKVGDDEYMKDAQEKYERKAEYI